MWRILFLALPFLGLAYAFRRTWCILPCPALFKVIILAAMLACFLMIFCYFGGKIDRLPLSLATFIYEAGIASIFIMLYLVLLFLILDLGRIFHIVPHSFMFKSLAGTLSVLGIMLTVFTYGYFHYFQKVRLEMDLETEKPLESPLKIVLISDLHAGYLNHVKEINRWIDMINKENADLVLIAGDIIDGSVRPLYEENVDKAFRRLNAPAVACLGNHEYYAGTENALKFYNDAGITLLRDEAATVKGISIAGRDDRTNKKRKSVQEITQKTDMSRYTILLDHQPYHLEDAENAGFDFQFSGHTHYGQVWPISWITDAIYEDAFGPLTKGKTQYYVSSGLGIWGAKFRIGTHSEYVVATLRQKN